MRLLQGFIQRAARPEGFPNQGEPEWEGVTLGAESRYDLFFSFQLKVGQGPCKESPLGPSLKCVRLISFLFSIRAPGLQYTFLTSGLLQTGQNFSVPYN